LKFAICNGEGGLVSWQPPPIHCYLVCIKERGYTIISEGGTMFGVLGTMTPPSLVSCTVVERGGWRDGPGEGSSWTNTVLLIVSSQDGAPMYSTH